MSNFSCRFSFCNIHQQNSLFGPQIPQLTHLCASLYSMVIPSYFYASLKPLVTSLQITDWLHSSHMIIEMYTAHM